MKPFKHYSSQYFIGVFLVFVFNNFSANGQLSGTYTIDIAKASSASNYQNVDDAVQDLLKGSRAFGPPNGPGVKGAVVFKIANGSYNVNSTITKIKGASSTNTITFASASGDSTKVLFSTLNSYSLLYLYGAKYINIKNITFSVANSGTSGALVLDGGSNFNTISGCRFIGGASSNKQIYILDADSNNLINNNFFSNGKYAIYSEIVSGSQGASGFEIKNNIIDSCTGYGMYLSGINSFNILANKIYNSFTSTYTHGIYIYASGGKLNITKNIIRSDYGMAISGSSGFISGDVFDNMIISSMNGLDIGLKKLNIYYNSIALYNSASNSSLTKVLNVAADSINIKNNNLANFGNGFAINMDSNSNLVKSDYNNFYVPDSAIAGWSGKHLKTIKNWIAKTKLDSHSISLDPEFVNINDDHALSPLLKAGIPLAGYTTDIDNKSRSTKIPVIGANEYAVYRTDAGIYRIDSLKTNYCKGQSTNVYIHLANYGTDTLKSTTISWTINGKSQTAYTWSGKLAPGKTVLLKIGSLVFIRTSTIKCWTGNVNNALDSNHTNDTSIIYIRTKMTGTYTIGGAGADFPGFKSASEELTRSGVCGSVSFGVKDSIYTEQFALSNIDGMSAQNSVSYVGISGDSSKVVATWPSSSLNSNPNYVLKLDSGSHFVFKHISFIRTGNNNNAVVIEMTHNPLSNLFYGCRFKGVYIPLSTLKSASIINLSLSWSYENVFRNCNFKYGSYLSYADAISSNYVLPKGPDTLDHNIIDSCITGVSSYFYVMNNTITNFVYKAIYNCSCIGNRIYSPINATEALSTCHNVINNLITTSGVGLYDCGNIYYNNVTLIGDKAGCDGYRYVCLNDYNFGYSPVIKNNIFLVNTSYFTNIYRFFTPLSGYFDSTRFNCNNAYTTFGKQALMEVEFNNTNASGTTGFEFTNGSFSNWGNGFDNFYHSYQHPDKNSLGIDPMPVSMSNPVANNYQLAHAGTPISGITKDIDGKIRDTKAPSIGATEITGYTKNTAITSIIMPQVCGDTNYTISAVIQNRGTSTPSKIPVFAIISNGSTFQKISDTISGNISPYATDTFIFKTRAKIYSTGYYTIKCYTALPGDQVPEDDTLSLMSMIVGNPIPVPKKTILCTSGKARLTLDGLNNTDKITWYKALNDTTRLSLKDTFITGSISKDTSFYVSQERIQKFRLGLMDTLNVISDTTSSSSTIYFKVSKSCSLDTVSLYPKKSGYVRLKLVENNAGVYKYSYFPIKLIITRPYQLVKVPLNIQLINDPKRRYTLIMDSISTGENFKYSRSANTDNNLYPVSIPGVISITSFYVTADYSLGCKFYPALYNISIHTSCPPQKFPFKVHVGGKPTFSLDRDPYFNGQYNSGTKADPDIICDRNIAAYRLYSSYPDADYGTLWAIKSISVQSSGGISSKDTSLIKPKATSIGKLLFNPKLYNTKDSIYKVSITIGTISGTTCDTTAIRYVKVIATPKVKFLVKNGCTGKSVSFTDSSISSAGSTYYWDFGDSSFSAATNPSHSYKTKGYYKVSLSIINASGCQDSTSRIVFINDYPKIKMYADSAGCMNSNIHFKDSTILQKAASRIWIFGDGASDTSVIKNHIYKSTGNFTATLKVTNQNGCSDSAKKKIVVYPIPKAGFTFDSAICIVNLETLTDTSINQSGTRIWQFGDGATNLKQIAKHYYSATGKYIVKLSLLNTYGCTDSASKKVVVSGMPKAVMKIDSVFCINSFIHFEDKSDSSVSKRTWIFGDGDLDTSKKGLHLYKNPGTYSLKLIVTNRNGCCDSITKKVIVLPKSKALFTGDTLACSSAKLGFIDLSQKTSGAKRLWLFGDGATDTSSNPFHNYKSAGTFLVKLALLNSNGCTDTANHKVIINPVPNVSRIIDSATCLGNGIKFADKVVRSTGESRNWTFGDGGKDTSKTGLYFYQNTGTYKVNLCVTNQYGCKDSITKNVNIYPIPKAVFNPDISGCSGSPVAFSDLSTSISGYQRTWIFGDGNHDTFANAVHIYKSAGTYNVKLVLVTPNSCADTAFHNVLINPTPKVNFTIDSVACLDAPVVFTDKSVRIASDARTWITGDGFSDTSTSVTHTYAFSGIYFPQLIVKTGAGCQDSFKNRIHIYQKPISSFKAKNVCLYDSTVFLNQSTDIYGSTKFTWLFDDSTGSLAKQVSHLFLHSGTHKAYLICTNGATCADTSIDKFQVYARPSAFFTWSQIKGLDINFLATDSNENRYKWDFGDKDTLTTGFKTKHTYISNGNYAVLLKVTNANSCEMIHAATITVQKSGIIDATEKAKIDIFPNPFQANITISFGVISVSDFQWQIFDVSGKQVAHSEMSKIASGESVTTIKTDMLQEGVYNLRILIDGSIYNKTVIKFR